MMPALLTRMCNGPCHVSANALTDRRSAKSRGATEMSGQPVSEEWLFANLATAWPVKAASYLANHLRNWW